MYSFMNSEVVCFNAMKLVIFIFVFLPAYFIRYLFYNIYFLIPRTFELLPLISLNFVYL